MRRWVGIRIALALALCAVAAGARAQGAAERRGPVTPAAAEAVTDDVNYTVSVTNNNLLGITFTNYGFIGNNFISRAPSFEYPLGSNHEHMVRAGLWIGAHAYGPERIGVSTGAIDGYQGSAGQAATEYTPAALAIRERSALANSPVADAEAVSEEDLITFYRDTPARSFSGEDHVPLNLLVRQETYDWSFLDYAHFIIVHLVITNEGGVLDSVWVGLYGEMASGNRGDYSSWPPSGWYRKKWIQYDDSLRLVREHYCNPGPPEAGCNLGSIPEWVGYTLLGVKEGTATQSSLAAKTVTFGAWDFQPGDSLRDEDKERYAIMSSGLIQEVNGPDFWPPYDPVELIAVGPFVELDPGDSISVDFAFVGGSEIADVRKYAKTARRAYDLNYVVPVPPPSPRFKVVAREQAVDFYWDDSPESAVDGTSPDSLDFEGYRLYLGEDRLSLHKVAEFDLTEFPHDTVGFNTGLAAPAAGGPFEIDGRTYQYRHTVSGLRDGFEYFAAVTSFDLGNPDVPSLESGISQNKVMVIPGPKPGVDSFGDKVYVFPNPYRVEARWDMGQKVRDHYLWFANLPEQCVLRIYTLSGDLVFETDFDGRTYAGDGARGVYNPTQELDVSAPTLSGSIYAWNMITRKGQAAATGLYLFSVEDKTGARKRTVGKFLIVKSDREE